MKQKRNGTIRSFYSTTFTSQQIEELKEYYGFNISTTIAQAVEEMYQRYLKDLRESDPNSYENVIRELKVALLARNNKERASETEKTSSVKIKIS